MRVRLGVVEGQVHLLDAAHVGGAVVGEAARDVGARGVAAGKVVVGASRAVDAAAGGDVVDGAVDGEVDGLGVVGAVVGGEFFESEVEGTFLLHGGSFVSKACTIIG